MPMTRANLIYSASLALHGVLALGVVSIKGARAYETVGIAMVEAKKRPAPKTETITPPPVEEPKEPVKRSTPKAKLAPVPAAPKEAAPAAAAAAAPVPDFGLSLGNEGSGGGGLALPTARPRTEAPAESNKPDKTTRKVLAAPAASACDEPIKKPKVLGIGRPAYTAAATEARAAGRVRVEVTVDVSGRVAKARVLEGLGYGLDEAALDTARAATFEPGSRCGKAEVAVFVIAIRFTP